MNHRSGLKELNNVKVDWSKVLEAEISWKEDLFPELNVRERYLELIRMLEQNRIQSRVVYSTDHVSAYCFLLSSSENLNRLYANIGFASEEDANEPRVNAILDWISSVGKKQDKRVFFDRPFNAPGQFDDLCESKAVHKIERVELRISPEIRRESQVDDGARKNTVSLEALVHGHLSQFAESEYTSYLDGPENVFLPASVADLERLILKFFDVNAKETLIPDASFVATDQGKIVGGIIALVTSTVPLISDLFVLPDHQGRGISRTLLSASLDVLMSKFAEVRLWSVFDSKAHELYTSCGFQATGRKEILYFTEK